MRNNKKLLAYYLPAFYQTPYNDKWWGEGFTEWEHVRNAQVLFDGHQALECKPHPDIGYYEMNEATLYRQQAMAKKYGLDGFVLYHYWFEGKRLLDMPFNIIMRNKDLDLPFCLMWANENWTRRWDGQENEILMRQTYSEQDCRNFIRSLFTAFADERYIRVEGRPLLMLYDVIPEWIEIQAQIWREECHGIGLPEPFLIHRTSSKFYEPVSVHDGWDGAFEFTPRDIHAHRVNDINENYFVWDYKATMVGKLLRPESSQRLFTTIIPSWDNSPRMGANNSNIGFGSRILFLSMLGMSGER
jgi:hypothetical protein